jgi:hypothetical protein
VEIIPYAPSGTPFLKKNVRRKVGSGNNAFILQNHGVWCLERMKPRRCTIWLYLKSARWFIYWRS